MEPPSPIWALGVNHFPSGIFINQLGKGLTQEVNACGGFGLVTDAKVSWFVRYVFHPLNLNLGTILNHYFKCFLRLFGRDNARMSRHAVVQRIQPRVKCSTINSACSAIKNWTWAQVSFSSLSRYKTCYFKGQRSRLFSLDRSCDTIPRTY